MNKTPLEQVLDEIDKLKIRIRSLESKGAGYHDVEKFYEDEEDNESCPTDFVGDVLAPQTSDQKGNAINDAYGMLASGNLNDALLKERAPKRKMSEYTYTYAELQAVLKQSESEGYLRALDDVQEKIDHEGYYPQIKIEFTRLVNDMKQSYQEQNDGKD